MFQQNKLFTFIVLVSLSIIFYYVSSYGGRLQELYTGTFNSFQSLYFQVSNITSALMPLLIFVFIYMTNYFMFTIVDINKKQASLSRIITKSLVPILIYSILFLLALAHFVENSSLIEGNIKNIELFYNLTFQDFRNIGLMFWLFFYVILIIETKNNYQTTYIKSITVNLTPSIIVLIIKNVI